ncbi:MAG TPA: hypothetical protein VIL20_03115, partial [Sandaracinaceae bacterium]
AACFVLSLALASTARAQDDAELAIGNARELVLQARFGDAAALARALLERDDLSAAERNAALEVLAIAQLADRRQGDAEETLRLLYGRDPGHRLGDPDASPPVLSAFARARESRPTPVTVRLEHDPPRLARREAAELSVRVAEGRDAIAELRLVYRMGSEPPARVVMTPRGDGTYVARIPVVGDPRSPIDVAYHVVALAPSLTPLASLGSAAEPLSLRIPAEQARSSEPAAAGTSTPPEPTPLPPPSGGGSVVEEWWFWTLLAVLVVGAGVTTGILLGPAQQGPEPGTLGSVRLMSIELP